VCVLYNKGSQDRKVSEYLGMGWTIGVQMLAGARDFSLLQDVQISSGTWPAFYSKYVRVLSQA